MCKPIPNLSCAAVQPKGPGRKPAEPEPAESETTRWASEELSTFKRMLLRHGRDWAAIAVHLPNKLEAQCKNFYHNNKKRLNLEGIIERHARLVWCSQRAVVGCRVTD